MRESELAVALALEKGPLRQIQIAHATGYTRQRVNSLVKRLQRHGLLVKLPDGRMRLQSPITSGEVFDLFHLKIASVMEKFNALMDCSQTPDEETDVRARVFRAMLEVWSA